MSYEWEDTRTWSDSGFFIGMLTGVTVGIGIGMLFAPQAGADLRHRLADSASHLKERANEGYRQASSRVHEAVERGKEAVERGKEAVQRGQDTWSAARRESDVTNVPISGSGTSPLDSPTF